MEAFLLRSPNQFIKNAVYQNWKILTSRPGLRAAK